MIKLYDRLKPKDKAENKKNIIKRYYKEYGYCLGNVYLKVIDNSKKSNNKIEAEKYFKKK